LNDCGDLSVDEVGALSAVGGWQECAGLAEESFDFLYSGVLSQVAFYILHQNGTD